MKIYTRKGDAGTTGLLFGGARISKADLRTEAYGTTDEAVSALGLARAALAGSPLTDLGAACCSGSSSWSAPSWPPTSTAARS